MTSSENFTLYVDTGSRLKESKTDQGATSVEGVLAIHATDGGVLVLGASKSHGEKGLDPRGCWDGY